MAPCRSLSSGGLRRTTRHTLSCRLKPGPSTGTGPGPGPHGNTLFATSSSLGARALLTGTSRSLLTVDTVTTSLTSSIRNAHHSMTLTLDQLTSKIRLVIRQTLSRVSSPSPGNQRITATWWACRKSLVSPFAIADYATEFARTANLWGRQWGLSVLYTRVASAALSVLHGRDIWGGFQCLL